MVELIISHAKYYTVDVELNDDNYNDVEQQMMLINQSTSINQMSIIILMMLIIPTITD